MRLLFVVFPIFLAAVAAQDAKEGTAGDAQKLVKIRQIVVEGTRLPALSVIRLAQIKTGDETNFMKLQGAMQKVTQSGLIGNIEFEYESAPDKETDVILHLKCTDVKPSARASIQIANVNEDDVWDWLTKTDPMFTREMPPTEAAIRLYSQWIGKYMESHGVPKFQENFAVAAAASSSGTGDKADLLVFKVIKRRGVK
jgi:hypothetical protein